MNCVPVIPAKAGIQKEAVGWPALNWRDQKHHFFIWDLMHLGLHPFWTPKLELLIFCGLVPILCGHDGVPTELPS
jgi:hypothetical protein